MHLLILLVSRTVQYWVGEGSYQESVSKDAVEHSNC